MSENKKPNNCQKRDKLSRRQGVTVAVGFKSGTFSEYQETLMEKLIGIWHLMQILAYTIAKTLADFSNNSI
ncbi:hypothetical protein KOY49_01230 [Candidatus Minimicrobia vallesae]|uniref:Uncharacterized protein n=1 Tax=Candidatus Minimicrobia vallesae TaxID=2841264 RepID=A0A8F1MB64_9BACT|nr:hypothetical protein [Candidatus Minimicrobia vallesae]QWQ31622.1 hypothetical protein KOY49_01230 [Candidatus Minimicrobia vallesae]